MSEREFVISLDVPERKNCYRSDADVLTLAQRDIMENWMIYRQRFEQERKK